VRWSEGASRLLVTVVTAVGCVASGVAAGVAAQPARQQAPQLAVAQGAADSSGSAGIGDPYFPRAGNGGYEVQHYDVRVRFDPASERVTGTTTVRATSRRRLTSFHLDLALNATSVRVNGERSTFRQRGLELIVGPRTPVARGGAMRVRVRYAGVPARRLVKGYTPWVTTVDGAVAVGEPEIAAWWFPSNDHPSDRATFDITIDAPRRLQALSNGTLVDRTRLPGRLTRWHWRTSDPMATYLAFMAVGRYDVRSGVDGRLPYTFAVSRRVDRQTTRDAWRSLRRTAPATRFLASRFGDYPFDSIGGVVPGAVTSGNFSYALENQTRPLYAPGFFANGPDSSIIVHEMAHQWFGDAVTLRRWRNIWINEGFATYAEWLWWDRQGGPSAQQQFRVAYDAFDARERFWRSRIGDPGPGRLFHNTVYLRGAMTAHALRNRMGTNDFFALTRRYVARGGSGDTSDLRRLAERISGERLGGFFKAWLYTARKPAATSANGVQR
jgi:aminopeptidase N